MYIDQVYRDSPILLEDFLADSTKHVSPIIADNHSSIVVGNGVERAFTETVFSRAYENNSFTLEAWILPYLDEDVSILAGANGGLFWDGEITFSVSLTSGLYYLSYKPEVKQVFHVAGVYDGISLLLYINGKSVDRVVVESGSFLFDHAVLVSGVGQGRIVLDGLAVYDRAISAATVSSHYLLGRKVPKVSTNISALGAATYNLEDQPETIESQKWWGKNDLWQDGVYTGVTISNNVLSGQAGAIWQGIIPVPFVDKIKRSRVNWSGEGSFLVETSIDNGVTWSIASALSNVPQLSNGTDQYNIDVRITFLGEAIVFDLEVSLYISDIYRSDVSTRPIIFAGDVITAYNVYEHIEYRADRGARVNKAHAFLPSDPNGLAEDRVHGLDMWVRMNDVTNSYIYSTSSGEYLRIIYGKLEAGGASVYINGVSGVDHEIEPGEWIHVLAIFNAPSANKIAIGANIHATGDANLNGQIGSFTTYPIPLSIFDVDRIYRSYLGGRSITLYDESTVSIVESENAWDLYNYAWSTL